MNLPSSSASVPSTLVALLRGRAQHQPDRRAYLFLADGETEEASFTYAELDRRARAIAARLQTITACGDRALLLYPPGLEFLAAFFGCLYAGVIAVPSYPPKRNRPDRRLQAIAADAGATVVLTNAEVADDLEARLTHSPELRAWQWLATDRIPTDEAAGWRDPQVRGDDLAFLQYTSGSTSTPKGVMVSHGNLLHTLDDLDRGWDHTPDSVMVTWLPIFHDLGLIYGALIPLFKGFFCVMLPPPAFLQRPVRWLEAISRYRATHSAAPNFAYDLCVAGTTPEQRARFDLRSWRMSLNAAEPVRAETLAAFNAAFAPCGLSPLTVTPGFGLAEATLKVSALPCAEPTRIVHVRSDELAQHRVVLGGPGTDGVQPIVGCGWRGRTDNRYLIVDPVTCEPCAEDHVGEIWFAGASVALGYWKRPAETAETFQARLANGDGPFLRTGDLGFVRGEELFVTGRVKDLIIIRGLNHYPQDIELTVEKGHPALRPACGAAFSVEIDGHETLVIAQEVERTYLRKLNVDEVVAAIRKAVAEQHDLQVSAIALLRTNSVPKTSSGKIMRRACRQQYLAGELELVGEWRSPVSSAPPFDATAAAARGSVEQALVVTWLVEQLAQRLQLDPKQIDAGEPFSRYGLDSMTAVELSGELERWMGRRLPPTLIYDYPSIQALASHLVALVDEPDAGTKPATEKSDPTGGAADELNPIAVVGMGCRFPGAESTAEFWTLLRDGREAITRVPPGRWDPATADAPEWGGFLPDVEAFDAEFFGIAPREADLMDPQQRILLEVAYAALEDAGIVPRSLAGSRTGVFVGISTNDYGRLLARVAAGTDAHAGTGNALSIAANRISYLLDLRGPSLVLDTACSSSLVAVHHAVRSLRAGESTLALVGGVNLILAPELTTTFARAGMLAPDGRCKTFDAAANGYVRGEGCGVLVLKRLRDAERDGDRVLAVIRGSAINQDGRSNGLTAPNGPAQQAVVRAALRDAAIPASALSYVEAHGTGTSLGDPIEVNALRDVLLEQRDPQAPCWIGSVKTNIGHLEAAAGIAGLIKVVLALQHRTLPPHLHLRAVNPLIQLANTPISIPTVPTPWPGLVRVAGVSSFGFGGTNAHVIVSEPRVPRPADNPPAPRRAEHALVLSARTAPALRALAASYVARIAEARSGEEWTDLCHAAATQRGHFAHRLAVNADRAHLLAGFSQGAAASGVWQGEAGEPPRLALWFPSEADQRAELVGELYASLPVFRAAVDECRAELASRTSWDLTSAFNSPSSAIPVELSGAVAFAVGYALHRAWRAWGVEPVAVSGAGAGEIAAAVAAGVLSRSEAIALLFGDAIPPKAAAGAVGGNGRASKPPALISAETGAAIGAEARQREFWLAPLKPPFRSRIAADALHAAGVVLSIDLGSADEAARATGDVWLPALRKDGRGWQAMLDAAAQAFVRGVPIRWQEVDRGFAFARVELPHYPFQRQRHWFDPTPAVADVDELARLAVQLAIEPELSPSERAAAPAVIAALLRAHHRSGDPLAGYTYEVRWPAEPLGVPAAPAAGRWLVLGPAPQELESIFDANGQTLERAEAFRSGDWRGALFWAGDEPGESEAARLLRAMQTANVPLWIATRGAVATSADDARVRLDHAPLWGMGKVYALEHPERWGALIDLPADPTAVDLASLVAELLGHPAGEDQVAWRGGVRHVARLEPAPLPPVSPLPVLRADAAYWVTGGTGALGLQVAQWLVARGARRLVLTARRSPGVTALARIADLEKAGVTVRCLAADVAVEQDVRRVLAQVGAELGPVRGIVHAAGVVSRVSIAELTPEALADVLRPKLGGARALDAATAGHELDFFVLFSSIAALWGAKGQAHYAAANAALDALAQQRRATGRPALSVGWGPWSGGGMAGPEEQALLARYGVSPLDPAVALAALDRALGGTRAQVAVARVDWAVFKEFFELHGAKPFLALVGGRREPAAAGRLEAELAALATAAPEQRRGGMEAFLQQQVAAVLGFKDGRLPEVRQGFFALGMDSMMAVDLGRRLSQACGRTLSSTLVFDHASIHLLAAHLVETLFGADGRIAAPAAPTAAAETAGAATAAEETDVETALAQRLEKLESLIRST
ncbi:type I polyketide synthase [Opitutus terrae]|uniref:Beta-ketoacyl synthase n=1 Tax=Opitutus terrae (strain DSM 11246 / JCM 15787 / PB90-1) TaxID=452637 RepID=B1ZYK8_OPITP|nr:type I polyketide synthase [Opitutus terrae]ACB75244.1 Beta-ketoacyl synthase [Opitutus terrae PB90-1]